jgi:hypothetical protein
MTMGVARRAGAAFLFCALLAACSNGGTSNPLAIPDKGHLLGNTDQSSELAAATPDAGGVNAYLWRGAIDVLSFMPFASADPVGGVIITDWYTPPTVSGERFKAEAYILGRTLAANDVRVSVFRQVQQDGQWVDATVAPETASDITDQVLARARELRAGASG